MKGDDDDNSDEGLPEFLWADRTQDLLCSVRSAEVITSLVKLSEKDTGAWKVLSKQIPGRTYDSADHVVRG